MPVSRRAFLQAGAALPLAAFPRPAAAAAYRVGVGRESDPYGATVRAIAASGEFPDVLGRTVVVKPNLMMPAGAETGATTDPEVTRAVVDRALAGGAAMVVVAETSPQGAHFIPTGHDGFASYDARVTLVDVKTLPTRLASVPGGGLAYHAVYLPDLFAREDIVFINVAKLKMHEHGGVTLTLKNLFGIPAVDRYISSPLIGRFSMHDRGLSQTVLDLNLLRPSHFAIIDGIWGMEGRGPAFGSPVRMNAVIAGRNCLAVDRVGMALMGVPQHGVRHVAYAYRFGLGPHDLSAIEIAGDTVEPRPFAVPLTSPVIDYPRVFPSAFQPGAERVPFAQWYGESCLRRVQVVRLYNEFPRIDVLRTIASTGPVAAGIEWLSWDGRDDAGSVVPPGGYAIHVRAFSAQGNIRHSNAVGWVTVTG